jgi:hypothetical protein
MVHKDLLIHKSQMLLGEFLAPMLEQVDKPRKRFLQQAIRSTPPYGVDEDSTPSPSPPATPGCFNGIYRYLLTVGQIKHFVSGCKAAAEITHNKQCLVAHGRSTPRAKS